MWGGGGIGWSPVVIKDFAKTSFLLQKDNNSFFQCIALLKTSFQRKGHRELFTNKDDDINKERSV